MMRFHRASTSTLAFALAPAIAGCGSDDAATAAASTTTTTSSTTTSTGAGGAGDGGAGHGGSGAGAEGGGSSTCTLAGLAPGDHHVELDFGGQTRSYELHVPADAPAGGVWPLVLNFHGLTSNATQQASFSQMSVTADAHHFLVAYPQGLGDSWNAGICCGTSATTDVDDVGFARAVVADIAATTCVDDKRVYATGMSNGGFLSHRLACEAADLFAAIGPVAGVMGVDPCEPVRPVPVIHFHGTADGLVPYDGGGFLGSPSVADTMQGWADRDGCTGAPKTTLQNGSATCQTWDACSDGVRVTLCTVEGAGHCWPGQSLCPYGTSTTDISANEEMWKVFADFTLP